MIAQILIADDDQALTTLLNDYLTSLHHRVIVVHDGVALMQKACEHQPHLIISDIQMPGAYGTSVYQLLRKEPTTIAIPILFMSSHPYERVKPLLPNDPKTRFLQKPVALDKLDATISELLPMGGYIP
jgi:CheY-like chemotaxis protein